MSRPCVHADAIRPVPPPGSGCETCLEIGDTWVHLRQCLTCGRTLCCDVSPNRHSSRHCRAEGHPVIRSAEPGEDWVYCFGEEAMIRETPAGWEAFNWFVEAGIEAATAHVARGLTLENPDVLTADGFDLSEWAMYVRARREAGTLDADDAASIEALAGWAW
jgi:hypothetical protein